MLDAVWLCNLASPYRIADQPGSVLSLPFDAVFEDALHEPHQCPLLFVVQAPSFVLDHEGTLRLFLPSLLDNWILDADRDEDANYPRYPVLVFSNVRTVYLHHVLLTLNVAPNPLHSSICLSAEILLCNRWSRPVPCI